MRDRHSEQENFEGEFGSREPKTARGVERWDAVPDEAMELSKGRALGEIIFLLAILLLPPIFRLFVFGADPADGPERGGPQVYSMVFLNGAIIILAIWWVLYLDRHPWRSLGLHFKNLGGEVVAAVVALGVIFFLQLVILGVVSFLFPELMERVAERRQEVAGIFPPMPLWFIIIFGLFVGVYEELLFRGFLMTRLKRLAGSVVWAIIISSVIFGMVHFYQDVLAMFQIFLIAIVLGVLFAIRGSLISPILVHAAIDIAMLSAIRYSDVFMDYFGQ